MELKEFIEKSLSDICLGIKAAQNNTFEKLGNYPISPAFIDGKPVYNKNIEKIEFDICVTTSENTKSSKVGNGNIKVVSASLSSEEQAKMENISRIKFSVPFFPAALNSAKQSSSDERNK